MNKQKLIIFESVKGAGKSSTLDRLFSSLNNTLVCGENITLEPIRNSTDKLAEINYYKKLLGEIKISRKGIILLDRFHFTKWPIDNFDPNYFKEIEEILLQEFEPHLIFLYVNPKVLLERLQYTNLQRSSSGWKLNFDGSSIQQESQKDIIWQDVFIGNIMKSTLIPNNIVDTSSLHIGDFDKNSRLIAEEVIKIIS